MIGRLVILLLVANAAWFVWSQGWLRGVGLAPNVPTEPERLERQVRPEALEVRPLSNAPQRPAASAPAPSATGGETVAQVVEAATVPAPAASAAAATPARVCLQAGVFDEKQAATLRPALAKLPEGSWRLDEVQLPGRWMVYVGKLADASAVAAKRAEIRELGVDTDRPGPALEPGLSLGRFSNQESAERALSDLNRKGVKTARVVQERRDESAYRLRLQGADDTLRQQARSLRGALGGRELRDCD
jgi:hypothetical protein